MPDAHLVCRFAGLYSSTNTYGLAPNGAAEIADDCVIRSQYVLEPRRGYSSVANSPAVASMGWKDGKLLCLSLDNAAAGVTGKLQAFDPALNSFSWLTMYPGQLPFAAPAGNSAYRPRFVSANKSVYFQSQYGLTKIESVSSGTCQPALHPTNWTTGYYASNAFVSVAGASNWLANGNQVAYRFTICRLGANNELIESEPSERLIVSNTRGTSGYVVVTTWNSWMLPQDAFFRVYRSRQVANGTPPLDEMFLVTEVPAGHSPDANGYYSKQNGITVNDYSPDTSIYVPLYTNPVSGNGISQANTSAPASMDAAWFKSRMLRLNTTDVQRLTIKIIGTGTGGIQDGDYIVVNGFRFVFRLSPSLNTDIALSTGGTVAQNVEATARALVGVINDYNVNAAQPLSGTLMARYISTDTTDPGIVLIQSLLPGTAAFSFSASSANGWDRNYTSGRNSDPNAQPAGLSWSPIGQPESAPLANFAIVGDAASEALRVVPLKEAALVFKRDDGLWRWTDAGTEASIALTQADPRIRLIASETAQSVGNYCLALCDQGVMLITENGQSVNVSQDQIGRELEKLLARVGRSALQQVAFAVANEVEHQYILCLPESPNATTCTLQYVFNLETRTWTRWRLPGVTSGTVNPTTGQLIWAVGAQQPAQQSSLWIERKNFDSTDYQDPSFQLRPIGPSVGTAISFSGWNPLTQGDILAEVVGTEYVTASIASVSYSASTNTTSVTLSAAPAVAFDGSLVTVIKAVPAVVKFLPFHAGSPSVLKTWGDCYLLFRYLDLAAFSTTWSTEKNMPTTATETVSGPSGAIFLDSFGSAPFGSAQFDRQTRDVIYKTTIPQDWSDCALLTLQLSLPCALAKFELAAIDVKVNGISQDVVR